MDALPLPLNDRTARPSQQRVAPLATLPLFWTLKKKRVVVAGGSDAAAWKAELLAACGAEVHLHAPRTELSNVFLDLLRRGAAHEDGRLVHHDEIWHSGAFSGATLAIADCDDDAEAEAFFNAARVAGVTVNVIDKPAFCQFQFGSIVNRSPVVVSISTDGAAPILAQAIRRRIEALLPPAIKDWATIAQAIRERVNARLKPGAARRTFWERFVDRAFLETPEEGVETRLMEELGCLSATRSAIGRVTIVGAGPGDAELLTLKAVRALQAADVIVFDEPISNDVLELSRREARRQFVGRPDSRVSDGRGDIHNAMVELVLAGKRVVRLKSGDPTASIGMREEIRLLEIEGISVEIVPGVKAERRRSRTEVPDEIGGLANVGIAAGLADAAATQVAHIANH
ncbi:uroporphyrin-III C-methyltransferase/precorrin-2 dehydrogenase/sirohydrochlorin ferrochelatase [Sinorhizobium terangae]|uniref:Siroheme synthase n=1 Tax=Sinorhizobium terangae TaxID=110322 RepID=A0A6N7LDS3_SINTE|nr:SAM-dependent methyltransferase [Sinorhizobium terangae]MBB4186395.1 uroporphyrin-III C-methyltransferase/precorrin-2 dehydrogenase/sirohydrochlorin ferrochelatase [Sinorhizobium terangae]MQX16003.1 siroheme synthase [Sinorhizobium terangae]